MIICPCCGSNVEGDLRIGCPSCGARAIGPPLAKPEHQLTSYGRAGIALVSGTMMFGAFLSTVIAALVKNGSFPRHFSTIVAAGEVASWRLKWFAVPVSVGVLWSGARLIQTIKFAPSRFAGLRLARSGFLVSCVVTLLIGILIGITIPERLRQRQMAIDATWNARGYTINRAILEYRELHGTLPTTDLIKELGSVPDPDGSIAEALRYVDVNGYQASTVVAAASTKNKPVVPRGGAIRYAATTAGVDPPSVSFTNYELRLPGPDKLLNTDDDFIVHDGIIWKVSEPPPSSTARSHPSSP